MIVTWHWREINAILTVMSDVLGGLRMNGSTVYGAAKLTHVYRLIGLLRVANCRRLGGEFRGGSIACFPLIYTWHDKQRTTHSHPDHLTRTQIISKRRGILKNIWMKIAHIITLDKISSNFVLSTLMHRVYADICQMARVGWACTGECKYLACALNQGL